MECGNLAWWWRCDAMPAATGAPRAACHEMSASSGARTEPGRSPEGPAARCRPDLRTLPRRAAGPYHAARPANSRISGFSITRPRILSMPIWSIPLPRSLPET